MPRLPWPLVLLPLVACGESEPVVATCPDLGGTTFTIRVNCSEAPTGGDEGCVSDDEEDAFSFVLSAGDSFSITDDGGRTFGGTLDAQTMTWTRSVTTSSRGAYSESGTFTFISECQNLVGTSGYAFDDGSAAGACTYTGRVGGYPDAPDAVGTCE